MADSVESIGAKLDALGLWDAMVPYHWALRPRGTVFPYFCSTVSVAEGPVKARLLLLEGWQTFHDYVRGRIDRSYGFYSSPMELPHFELVVLARGGVKLYRNDPGYVPREVTAAEASFSLPLLWEVYGVMLRCEADAKLPLVYSAEKAMFSRVEDVGGQWRDEPLTILEAPPYVEQISFPKELLARAKDLPFAADEALELDFRMLPGVMTREARPRTAYVLAAIDAATSAKAFREQVSFSPEAGLKALWTAMPARVLMHIVGRGRVPGEIRLVSPRVFRMLRPLCLQLPLKLSLHDRLPELEKSMV